LYLTVNSSVRVV